MTKDNTKNDPFEIAGPCEMKWQELEGDDVKKFCSSCQKHVHNVSSLSAPEAEEFIKRARCEGLCVYIERDADTRDPIFSASQRTQPQDRFSILRTLTSLRLKTLAPPALALFLAASAFGTNALYEDQVQAPIELSGDKAHLSVPCDLSASTPPETHETPLPNPFPSPKHVVMEVGEPPIDPEVIPQKEEPEPQIIRSLGDVAEPKVTMGKPMAPKPSEPSETLGKVVEELHKEEPRKLIEAPKETKALEKKGPKKKSPKKNKKPPLRYLGGFD